MQTYSNKTSNTSKKQAIISVNDVSLEIDHLQILEHVSFDVEPGSIVYIVGANGSGKSSLMKLLMGLRLPTSGSIHIQANNVGYLPQNQNIRPAFPITVEEVIYSGFKHQKLFIPKETKNEISLWLKKMQIEDLYAQPMNTLSGGEQQRVLFIRALVNNPEVLILDEPTSALDPMFKLHFNAFVEEMHERGTTIIYVTHDLHDKLTKNSRVILINKGLEFDGSISDYYNNYIKSEVDL